MMEILTNLALKGEAFYNWFHGSYDEVISFLDAHKLNGIEAILYKPGNLDEIPTSLVKGLHLIYWPMWLDLWLEDNDNLYKEFINDQSVIDYYGFNNRQGFINQYKNEFSFAKKLSCEYMVYHVSHISIEETYTRDFAYSNKKVLTETANLVNQVFIGDGPLLLFENLWSAGLNYLDYDETKAFIESINYENIGLCLDISHLLITNKNISNYDEAINYIEKVIDNLGDLKKYIKTIHLNKSCFSNYIRENHQLKANHSNEHTVFMDKLIDVYQHISKIDTHIPFEDCRIKELISSLAPNWLVYEFLPESLDDWSLKIKRQNEILTR